MNGKVNEETLNCLIGKNDIYFKLLNNNRKFTRERYNINYMKNNKNFNYSWKTHSGHIENIKNEQL